MGVVAGLAVWLLVARKAGYSGGGVERRVACVAGGRVVVAVQAVWDGFVAGGALVVFWVVRSFARQAGGLVGEAGLAKWYGVAGKALGCVDEKTEKAVGACIMVGAVFAVYVEGVAEMT